MAREWLKDIDGYDEVAKELEFSRKYGPGYADNKGKVAECIDRFHPGRMTVQVSDIIGAGNNLTTTIRSLDKRERRGFVPATVGEFIVIAFTAGELLGATIDRSRVPAEARVDFGIVDASRQHLQQHFSGADSRPGNFTVIEFIVITISSSDHRKH